MVNGLVSVTMETFNVVMEAWFIAMETGNVDIEIREQTVYNGFGVVNHWMVSSLSAGLCVGTNTELRRAKLVLAQTWK